MRAQIGRLILAFAAFAAIAGSQTESYDVRHVRWGMSVAEVQNSEEYYLDQANQIDDANLRTDAILHGQNDIYRTDTVVGINDTLITYSFDHNPLTLCSVSFWPKVLHKPGRSPEALIAAKAYGPDDADYWLSAWFTALEKKYGKSYICSGDEKVCHLTTVESLEKARKLYHSANVKFSVEFTENQRTQVFIYMLTAFIDKKKIPLVYTAFFPFPKDNF